VCHSGLVINIIIRLPQNLEQTREAAAPEPQQAPLGVEIPCEKHHCPTVSLAEVLSGFPLSANPEWEGHRGQPRLVPTEKDFVRATYSVARTPDNKQRRLHWPPPAAWSAAR
jgi:hypothetical protein